jgi:hypothetical protein
MLMRSFYGTSRSQWDVFTVHHVHNGMFSQLRDPTLHVKEAEDEQHIFYNVPNPRVEHYVFCRTQWSENS